MISMLSGLYKSTKGKGYINNMGIEDEMESCQKQMGICPQFDLLWPQLSVEEHLKFYSRLKGSRSVEADCLNALKSVNLEEHKSKESGMLSGGMRRRLSVAIAMLGQPALIFLDEPTTGLDPENRRQLWNIIIDKHLFNKRNNLHQSIIITTHSMEEADVLCTRIAILQKGVLRCIGP